MLVAALAGEEEEEEKMYESVEVAGLNSSPNSFFMMDFYNQNRACLIQDKGAVNPNPYSTPVRNQHWNSSNHCTYNVILRDLTALS
ncbi:hypothetical protein E2320_002722 [Naja naja]|nr:hypothetical protein E2320_002722 [Naja naja]